VTIGVTPSSPRSEPRTRDYTRRVLTESVKVAFRRVPGARTTKRAAVAAFRAVHPLRPPVESPALVAKMLEPQDEDSFITGNGIAAHCRYVLNYDVFRTNDHVGNNWWFCNPEFLEYFFRELAPDDEFVLFTHNSNVDRAIDERFLGRLQRPNLIAWFATNVEVRHPKLFPLALGIGNRVKADAVTLKRVQDKLLPKTRLFEISFNVGTNSVERLHCIEQTGLQLDEMLYPTERYYERLASSYFCISPNGNGVDCYRTWQSLYLRTIPVVTRSALTEHHPDIPWIVLDDWSEFRRIDFSPELYEETWRDWSPDEISLDRYLERVRATISRVSSGRFEPLQVGS
jgi:hypothetical protein